jgi:3-deoxy-D-manno-octulosonic-acid transferase
MNLSYRIAATVFHRMPLPRGKLAQSRDGRLGAAARWVAWAREHRTATPLIWLHAASVGETQVIAPILTRLRTRHPSAQIVQTYSSPSMANWPLAPGVDRSDYAPAEHPEAVTAVCQALRPAALVVSRGDLWPNMTQAALEHRIPVAVVGATMRPGSRRLQWPARALLGPIHARLAFVGAVSAEDAGRWLRSGAPESAVQVTGDPRDDHVLERVTRLADIGPVLDWAAAPSATLVAGSTHPRDDRVLLNALAQVIQSRPSARLLLVPHEPLAGPIRKARRQAADLGIRTELWDGFAPPGDAEVLIVTRPGLLADLYAAGSVAYVGGGFDRAGLHSLAEPAALGLPILAGPAARRDNLAGRFLESGGVVAVGAPDAAPALAATWTQWIDDPSRRMCVGLAARRCLNPGTASATLARLEPLLRIDAM